MNTQNSRRSFLRGAFNEAPVMRPFGAGGETAFHDACTGCGDCVSACPENVLVPDRGGLPVFDPAAGACSFCGDCISACKAGALNEAHAWTWRAAADASCLSRNGVQCRACQDFCDVSAIRFQLSPGGRAQPRIDSDLCTGCGGCAAPCPVGAIRFTRMKPETEFRPC